MAYDEGLAQRLREQMDGVAGLAERRMFGGLAFMLNGNLACGVMGSDLVVRGGPDEHDAWLAEPGVRPFDFTGRPMRGWLVVDSETVADDEDLAAWVGRGVGYAKTLPAK